VPGPQPFLDLPPGSGPRHLAFHPSGAFVFIINELAMTMTAASWNAETGQMAIINTESTIPEGKPVPGGSTAEVLVHPSGRFVYGSNRGPNTIALFAIDPNNGRIRRIENFDTLGKIPRNFRISPDGGLLLAENQESNSIFSFRIDTGTGFLKPTGYSISTPKPACIKFLER
ncbi:MAG: beta-propeller fold lactonase family protein, partial [Planctomycetes bacterium]|nr:beta-propeller fold lactonase family protein [Planctomycetota bacterium]